MLTVDKAILARDGSVSEEGSAMLVESAALHILLIDDDELLLSDSAGLEHRQVAFTSAKSTAEARIRCASSSFDVAIVSLDIPGGEDFIRECGRRAHPPGVIAIAGHGAPGMTLEHKLLRAELRGARQTFPKPIDAIELAIAAVSLTDRLNVAEGEGAKLIAELERRLAY